MEPVACIVRKGSGLNVESGEPNRESDGLACLGGR
jgi:hypothetical protein